LAKNEKKGQKGRKKQGADGCVAALRRRRNQKRGGNDAPWKAWKTQKASFPLFPPGLEIRPKAPDSHISTAPTAGLILKEGQNKRCSRK
jgi:hypothetical protein